MNTLSKTIGCIGMAAALFSCSKHHDVLQPISNGLAVHVELMENAYIIQYDTLKSYEAIFSEPGGKVLMDTLIPYNILFTANLNTSLRRIDITTVEYFHHAKYTYIDTYRSIDPSTFSIEDTAVISPPPPTQKTDITYINTPSNDLYKHYVEASPGYYFNDITQDATTLLVQDLNYNSGDYIYLAYPDAGLYNLHQIKSSSETVDVSHMDTGIQITYNKPATMSLMDVELAAYPDTSSLSHKVFLKTNDGGVINWNADFLYPGNKYFQAFDLSWWAANQGYSQEVSYTCTRCTTLPTSVEIPDASYFNLVSSPNDSISFQWIKQKPSAYQVEFDCSNNTKYRVFVEEPDTTVLHPIAFLNRLSPRFLSSNKITGFNVDFYQIMYGAGNGMTSFVGYPGNAQGRQIAGRQRMARGRGVRLAR